MGKQSPKKRKSEVNSNETPKKAKVVSETIITPVNSPVKQTPQKNKTPKSQKKQKLQSPAKEQLINGVANKKVQIQVNKKATAANTPDKEKGEKKYPVTPATKPNAENTPKQLNKSKKRPASTADKQNDDISQKFSGIKSLENATDIAAASKKKKKSVKEHPGLFFIPAATAATLNKRQIRRRNAKLKKKALLEDKMHKANVTSGNDSAPYRSMKEILQSIAEGNPYEKLKSQTVKKISKKEKKMAARAANNNTKISENTTQSPKSNENKKKKENNISQPQQAKGNLKNAANGNQNAQNKKQKGNQKKEKQAKQQQKLTIEPKKVESEEDNSEDMEENESDYEVETTIKPEKVTKKLNELMDSDNEEMEEDDDDDNEEDAEEGSDEEENYEETDNSLNENNENEHKDQKKQKKQEKKNPKGKQENPQNLKDAGILKTGQSRYVLFVGNLPYDLTKDQIVEYFKKSCEVKDVRIPTDKVTNKPKGFAYLEVPNEEEYHKGLAVHHSFINGRRINVLYTQGGTKNTENMKQKIKSKNFKLQAMRREGILPGGVKDSQKRSVRRAKKQTHKKKQQ